VRPAVNTLVVWIAAAALEVSLPMLATAQDPRPDRDAGDRQPGEDRWVASLAVTSGVLLQGQDGSVAACLFANPADATGSCPAPGSTPLRPSSSDDDLAIAAFVGADLELMSPALPIPTRPRLFLAGEIIPTFADDRDLAAEGDPSCVRGPEPGDPCASDEDPLNPRNIPYGETAANGQGSVLTTSYATLSFGANLGVAFPVQVGERRLRIRPSFGWFSYEAEASGLVVDAECEPPNRCTDSDAGFLPPPPPPNVVLPGSFRETSLSGGDTRRFHAIGPGLDVEMDTGRYGPLGTSIFLGGRAYRTLGGRTIEIEATQVYSNDGLPLANQAVSARWEVEFRPWIFRAGVGLRLQWLGWKS
jgi:hypothetical protein